MRILLQQIGTGLYFRDIDGWTRHASEAMDFVSSNAAIEFCSANKLRDLQMVFNFEEEQYEIVIPPEAIGEFEVRARKTT